MQGGSITHGYDARLLFNGRTYPSNPTVPPAMRFGKQPQGKVIVPLGIVGMPLLLVDRERPRVDNLPLFDRLSSYQNPIAHTQVHPITPWLFADLDANFAGSRSIRRSSSAYLVTQNPKTDTEEIRGKLGQESGTGDE